MIRGASRHSVLVSGVAVGAVVAIACGPGGTTRDGGTRVFRLGGAISGMGNASVVLRDRAAGESVTVERDGTFLFGDREDGASYDVVVNTPPPGSSCRVANGEGTISGADALGISIECASDALALDLPKIILSSGETLDFLRGEDPFTFARTVPFEAESVRIRAVAVSHSAQVLLRRGDTSIVLGPDGSSEPVSLVVGENAFTITVISASSVRRTYFATIERAPSTDARLLAFQISPQEGGESIDVAVDESLLEHAASVSYENLSVSIKALRASEQSTVTLKNAEGLVIDTTAPSVWTVPLGLGDNRFDFDVVAADPAKTRSYRLNVVRRNSTDTAIAKFVITYPGKAPIEIAVGEGIAAYKAAAAWSISSASIEAVTRHDAATVVMKVSNVIKTPLEQNPKSWSVGIGSTSNDFTFEVTAADGLTKFEPYTLTIEHLASGNPRLASLKITPSDGSSPTTLTTNDPLRVYSLIVENAAASVTIEAMPENSLSTIVMKRGTTVVQAASFRSWSTSVTTGVNHFTFEVKAPDETATFTYSLSIERELNANVILTGFTVTAAGTPKSVSVSNKVAFVSVDFDVASVLIAPVGAHALSTVSNVGSTAALESGAWRGNLGTSGTNAEFKFKVTAEDGSFEVYTLTVERQSIPFDAEDSMALAPSNAACQGGSGGDVNKDGVDGEATKAIFVNGSTGNDGNDGLSVSKAVKTITAGLNKAGGNRDRLYITSNASYSESVKLQSKIHLFGGYSSDFKSRNSAQPTTIVGTADKVALAVKVASNDAIVIDGFVLRSLDRAGSQGRSSIAAVVAGTTNVRFRNVKFVSGKGEAGAAGSHGSNGSDGCKGDNGTAGYDGSFAGGYGGCSAASGTEGGGGGLAGLGIDKNGIQLCNGTANAGGAGGTSTDGRAAGGGTTNSIYFPTNGWCSQTSKGSAGQTVTCFGNHDTASYQALTSDGASGSDGYSPNTVARQFGSQVSGVLGLPWDQVSFVGATIVAGNNGADGGGGGGGGGSGAHCASWKQCGWTGGCDGAATHGSGGGKGGSGGRGGSGGTSGQGGGSSINLAVLDTPTVELACVDLTPANGGNGGRPGIGGRGGSGGEGGSGGGNHWEGGRSTGRGGKGGKGGKGADGQGGKGGKGGSVFGVAYRTGATVKDLSSTWSPGAVGAAGSTGSSDGTTTGDSGDVAKFYELK